MSDLQINTNPPAGGYLVGRSHKDGGIKAYNKSTGQFLEFEGKEVVITKKAVADPTLREFEGKLLTNRQILSKINESGGGVSFADGGEIPDHLSAYGNKYEFGGMVMEDNAIIFEICQMSEVDPEIFRSGGDISMSNIKTSPSNPQELKDLLRAAYYHKLPKKDIISIQEVYYFKYVSENPENLPGYLEALNVLPVSYINAYGFIWYDNDYLEELEISPLASLPIKESKIKKINFIPSPENKNLEKIFSGFTIKDEIQPMFSGVYFNKEAACIYASNRFSLLFLKAAPDVNESSICLMGAMKDWYHSKFDKELTKGSDGCWALDEPYPNIFNIVPYGFNHIVSTDSQKIYDYLITILPFTQAPGSNALLLFKDKGEVYKRVFNAGMLAQCIRAMLELGYDKIDLCFSESANRPCVIVPSGNARKISKSGIETDFALMMPNVSSLLNEMPYAPGYDIENNKAVSVAQYKGIKKQAPVTKLLLSSLRNYPEIVNQILNSSKEDIYNKITGSCSVNTGPYRQYVCSYQLELTGYYFNSDKEQKVVIPLLRKEFISSKNESKKEAFETLQNYLIDDEEIENTIAGLSVLLSQADQSESQDIKDSIEALKFINERLKFEKGGDLSHPDFWFMGPIPKDKTPILLVDKEDESGY